MCVFLAVGLATRTLAGSGGALAQYPGTALYAAMIYAGVVVLAPAARAWQAGAAALGFCWAVELLQLTGVPAELSSHSVLARLVLGARFDAADLLWYAVGVLPLLLVHASRSAPLRLPRRQRLRPRWPRRPGTAESVSRGSSPTPAP